MNILRTLLVVSSIFAVDAFAPVQLSTARLTSQLNAAHDDHIVNRRDAGIKTAAIAASGVLAGLQVNTQEAGAEDAEGRLIEFTVENLGGEAGNTGKFVVRLRKDWAPIGAERFEKLTEIGFWDEARAFRVLPNFIVQFGINGDPTKQALWRKSIPDDPVQVSNKRGTVTFATAGPNTRTTQIFINTGNNGEKECMNFI